MATIWITYAWVDNENHDIDFIAQELESAGLTVKLDRWNVSAGKRLWDQIEDFITSDSQSDGWLLIATNNSLASEACKEEYAYALDRALNSRGENYPVIALFLGQTDQDLIPAGIRSRLYVSITDPDWKDRIVAASEGRLPHPQKDLIEEYYLKVHWHQGGDKPIAIEVRPRAGVWAPFIIGIPANEKEDIEPFIMIGPRDLPTRSGMLLGAGEELSKDGSMWLVTARNQATPTDSYYIWCKSLPSTLVFGVAGKAPQHTVKLNQ